MAVYSISTSSMRLQCWLHLYKPLHAEGAARLLYDHTVQPSAEESNCPVYNRDVI